MKAVRPILHQNYKILESLNDFYHNIMNILMIVTVIQERSITMDNNVFLEHLE